MKDKLTLKESKFLEKYLQGRPLAECAKYAGSNGKDDASLRVIGYNILTGINISMEETLSLNGITEEYLAEKLKEGLNAKKKYFASFRGGIVESKPFDDQPTRMKAVEIAGRMKGLFVDKLELTGKNSGDIALMITGPGKEKQTARKTGLD